MIIASILIGLALAAIAAYFVLSPLQQWANVPLYDGRQDEKPHPLEREDLLAALRDLEFDHSTGKITDGDYQSLRADLMSKALTAPRAEELDAVLDVQIEAAVLSYRTGKRRGPSCDACGAVLTNGSRFCTSCGAPVVESHYCSHCGKTHKPGDAYCSNCGVPLSRVLEFAT